MVISPERWLQRAEPSAEADRVVILHGWRMLLRSPAASYSTGDSTAWMATLTLTIGRLGQAFRHGLIQYLVQLPIDLLGYGFLLRRHRCFALRQGGFLPGQGFSRLIERLGFAIDFSLFGVQALD